MLGRAVIGAGAIGTYAWRVEDPKGSYAAFYDLSDWLTGLVLTGEGIAGYLRNFVNLILIDQADGFLLGMAFFALLSLIFWPFKAAGRWGVKRVKAGAARRRLDEQASYNHALRVEPSADRTQPDHGPQFR